MAPRKGLSIEQSDEVAISAADAAQIAKLLNRVLRPARLPPASDGAPSPSRSELISRAEAVFRERERRTRFLNPAMFGEPAWDMLVVAYIMENRDLTVGKVIRMVGVPATTGLRWLQYLEKERLIVRSEDTDDRRIVRICLSNHGREVLDAYFASFPSIEPLG